MIRNFAILLLSSVATCKCGYYSVYWRCGRSSTNKISLKHFVLVYKFITKLWRINAHSVMTIRSFVPFMRLATAIVSGRLENSRRH